MDGFFPDGSVVIYSLPPKVGDTLTATVEPDDAVVSYQWYADGEEIEDATDDELLITPDMVGSKISVAVMDADGNSDLSDETEEVYAYTFEIEDAKASKVNEITVTFANPVEAENVTFAVTKGSETVPIEKVEATDWSIDEDEVKLKTSANMAKGTYTVTATDSVTSDTDSYSFEVTKQAVEGIVILNTKALTNRSDNAAQNHMEAYAYYDVLDQYGQSIRSSASIQWSGSCKIKADKATGKLTLTKGDGKAWVYNEQIFITGVYTKTGVAKSETLTVDTEQSLNSIEMVGFLKKGTSDIIQDLPADFKTQEYYLLFHALDQNDCPLEADEVTKNDVTFVSNDILVVKELTGFEDNGLTVKGTEYNAVFVEPGIRVADGGEVTVTAIANKTGNKTELNFMVGEDPVVDSFKILPYDGVIADGDKDVPIPFEAKTVDDKPITNFRALAKQKIFNTLSFNTSEGTLKLAETDTGAAKLTWTDNEKYYADTITVGANTIVNKPWSYGETTDDIDRPVSLTVVIVGGEPTNEMIYVSDKRRPNAIAEVKLDDVYVEGASIALKITGNKKTDTFKYYDQYGKQIGTDWGADNGFFKAAQDGDLRGTDFAEYKFGVRIEYAGTGYIAYNPDGTTIADGTVSADRKKAVIQFGDTAAYATTTNIQSAATGEGFKFEIAKFKDTDGGEPEVAVNDTDDWESVSPSKFKGITVVDITQVKNFKIGDLNLFYTGALDITGPGIINSTNAGGFLTKLKDTTQNYYATGAGIPTSHQQEIKVSGTYNGLSVNIPNDYFEIETTRGTLVDSNADDKLDVIGQNKIAYSELYDKTTPNGTAKQSGDEIKATINNIYAGEGFWKYDTTTKSLYVDEVDYATASATLDADDLKAAQIAAWNAEYTEGVVPDTIITSANLTAQLGDEKYKDQDAYVEADRAAYKAAKDAETAATTAKTNADNEVTTAKGEMALAKAALEATVTSATSKTELITEANKITVATVKADKTAGTQKIATVAQDDTKDGTDAAVIEVTTALDSDIATAVNDAVTATQAGSDVPDLITAANAEKVYEYLIAAKSLAQAKVNAAKAAAALTAATGTASQETAIADKRAKANPAKAGTGRVGAEELLKASEFETGRQKALALEADFARANGENYAAHIAGTTVKYDAGMYDSTKKEIKFSDQAPYAADITGLAESYTFNPTNTEIANDKFVDAAQSKKVYLKDAGDLTVVDQYGVAMANQVLEYTISNAVESKSGYAENNFKVSDNGTAKASITGAELGDTFDLVVSVKGSTLKKTTKVTVGADTDASIINGDNLYRDVLMDTLEAQRLAGLQ